MSLVQTVTAGVIGLSFVGGVIAPQIFKAPEVNVGATCSDLHTLPGTRDGEPVLIMTFVCSPKPVTLVIPAPVPPPASANEVSSP